MRIVVGVVLVVLFLGAIAYGTWQFKRNWNYSWGYESRVQETVCEMVKPEHLTEYGLEKCN